jgi:hypothetical protein
MCRAWNRLIYGADTATELHVWIPRVNMTCSSHNVSPRGYYTFSVTSPLSPFCPLVIRHVWLQYRGLSVSPERSLWAARATYLIGTWRRSDQTQKAKTLVSLMCIYRRGHGSRCLVGLARYHPAVLDLSLQPCVWKGKGDDTYLSDRFYLAGCLFALESGRPDSGDKKLLVRTLCATTWMSASFVGTLFRNVQERMMAGLICDVHIHPEKKACAMSRVKWTRLELWFHEQSKTLVP